VAFGFREVPSRSNGPVKIDTSVSKSISIDWGEETILVYQNEYSRVGILPRAAVDKFAITIEIKKTNAAMAIENAIASLKNQIPEFGKRPRKTDYSAIIDYLSIDPDSDYGYSFSQVSKAIVRNCGTKR
jgi:hypothetical protein